MTGESVNASASAVDGAEAAKPGAGNPDADASTKRKKVCVLSSAVVFRDIATPPPALKGAR